MLCAIYVTFSISLILDSSYKYTFYDCHNTFHLLGPSKILMMAVSSPLFSNFGVCLADPKNKKLNTIEAPLSTGIPVHYSSSQPSIVHSEFKNFDRDHLDGTVKKLNHNASERDRRKVFNSLCSSLRSLLPATDHTV